MDAPRLGSTASPSSFGRVRALDSFSLRLEAGEIRGLIGPNGSGKSTAFNVITGLYRPGGGEIRVDGRSVVGLRTDEIASRGVARTFQTLRLFRAMSVIENVMLGTHLGARPPSPAAMLLSLPAFRRFEAEARARSLAALEALHIADYAQEIAGNLPYGVQKRIDLARSLVANPSLLLLDEPAAGLTEAESHQLMELIRALHAERRFGLLLVEHDMQFVTNLPRITVIDFGKLLAEGTPREVRENADVVVAYLGTGELSAKAKTVPAALADASAPVLEVKDIGVRYGAVPALRSVSVSVAAGGITTIIGANGAGKTTLLATVSGIVAAHQGQVLYGGADVTRLSCEERVAQGIVMSPEGRRLFPEMTVQENLLLGAYSISDAAAIAAGLSASTRCSRASCWPAQATGGHALRRRAADGGHWPRPHGGAEAAAARRAVARPRPNLVELIFETIAEIRKLGCAIMLVEQNASMALEVADFGYVLRPAPSPSPARPPTRPARRDRGVSGRPGT
jgi:ABC-type branched-subunit amino acid transport system ATPase component